MSPPRLLQPLRADCRRVLAAAILQDLAESRAAEDRFARRIRDLKARDGRLAALGVPLRPKGFRHNARPVFDEGRPR